MQHRRRREARPARCADPVKSPSYLRDGCRFGYLRRVLLSATLAHSAKAIGLARECSTVDEETRHLTGPRASLPIEKAIASREGRAGLASSSRGRQADR